MLPGDCKVDNARADYDFVTFTFRTPISVLPSETVQCVAEIMGSCFNKIENTYKRIRIII